MKEENLPINQENLQNGLEVKNINDIKLEISRKREYANLVRTILLDNSVQIEGKNYVKAQGWIALANMHNLRIVIKNLDINKEEGIAVCECEVRDKNDKILSNQFGFAHALEIPSKPKKLFAVIGLAQTRAVARALKNVFAFIPAFLKEFEFTALEEMDYEYTENIKSINYKTEKQEIKKSDNIINLEKNKNLKNDKNEKNDKNTDTFFYTQEIIKLMNDAKSKEELKNIMDAKKEEDLFKKLNENQLKFLREVYAKKLEELNGSE